MGTVRDLLVRLEDDLGFITQRLFVLEAFAAELDRVTRGKPFRIWGSAVWMMALDSRDAYVTHLASWVKAAYSKGGALGQLQAHHARDFPRKWRQHGDGPKHDQHFASILRKQHDQLFARMFPEAVGASPGVQDFDGLRKRFVERVEGVVADRDANRAHPYERDGTASSSVRQLDLKELRELTSFIEGWLNALRQLSTGGTFAPSDMNFQCPTELAEELVDSVLMGSRSRATLVMGGLEREAYFQKLHDRHAARGNPDGPLFNDYVAGDELGLEDVDSAEDGEAV